MPQRVIHVGIGVWGKRWCNDFLKSSVADGTIEVAALVELDPQALEQGRIALGVDPERCFTDAARAFEATQADFCTVVVTPEHHERIFVIFQRLHSQLEFPGTGIGLATVRRVVLRHGGEVSAEGEINRGAVFSFTLEAVPESHGHDEQNHSAG